MVRDPNDEGNRYFVPLGIDRDNYFYRRVKDPQVMCYSKADHNRFGLLNLAPLRYWESRFVETKAGVNWTAAADHVMQVCQAKSVYNPKDVRGRGTWNEDDGRLVFHTGKRIYVESKETPLDEFKSRYSYQAAWDLGLNMANPLSGTEGLIILETCRALKWRVPVSGDLLAGWIVLAPFCGALEWRPHIWLTGSAGSGKSTVLNRISRPLTVIYELFQGGTTQAGIGQSLQWDARPILFDEAERNGGNSNSDMRIQDLIDLIMVASNAEGQIAKGSPNQKATSAMTRSCFCLSSINTSLDKRAPGDAAGTDKGRRPAVAASQENDQ